MTAQEPQAPSPQKKPVLRVRVPKIGRPALLRAVLLLALIGLAALLGAGFGAWHAIRQALPSVAGLESFEANKTIFVSIEVANAIFNSCKNRCLSFGGGRTTEQEYGTATKFIEAFSWTSDPTYVPSLTDPYVYYKVGSKPVTGESILLSDITGISPFGADIAGARRRYR